MKKNSLTTAVVAGIAGVAGFAGLASAVDLNPDGLGQVLIFPYYTVNKAQDTLLSVVNTTDVGKAVKVRFLEGYNSRECLDFNLFLSPYDVWTAAVYDTGRADPTFGTPDFDPTLFGPALKTADASCTIPNFGGEPVDFRPFAYTGANDDTGRTDIGRCREGHFEMITMGDVIPGSDLDATVTHVQTGVPGEGVPECDPGYLNNGNVAAISADLDPPTGGIYGAGAVVNVAQGTFFGYNADAVEGFWANQPGNLYTDSGNIDPSLAFARTEGDGTATAYVFQNGNLITSNYTAGIDAVSAVFMADSVYNEWQVNPSIAASTDWVITFPTKRFYVDPAIVGSAGPAIPPFVEVFFEDRSCTRVGVNIFDREELNRTFVPDTCEISPCPPPDIEPPNSLCYETNVISFQSAGDTSSVLGSVLAKNIEPFGNAGHLILSLDDASEPHAMNPSNDGNVFHGLPATGFQATNAVNGDVMDGVLSNYSGLFRHRISRDCTGTGAGGACS
jgi:hypothetical protein